MVEHDIENDVDALRVRVVHEKAQLLTWVLAVGHKAGIDFEKILDPVAVIGSLVGLPLEELAILQHRREPYCAHTQRLQIVELLAHALDGAALKAAELGVKDAQGWPSRIVEPIHHQEINPAIPPVFRGRREPVLRRRSACLVQNGPDVSVIDRGGHEILPVTEASATGKRVSRMSGAFSIPKITAVNAGGAGSKPIDISNWTIGDPFKCQPARALRAAAHWRPPRGARDGHPRSRCG